MFGSGAVIYILFLLSAYLADCHHVDIKRPVHHFILQTLHRVWLENIQESSFQPETSM